VATARNVMITTLRHDHVLELRLERPPANALSPELIAALAAAVRAAPREARGLLLSGRAGMFSAGLDVPLFAALDRGGAREAWRAFLALMRLLVELPIPLACALTGHAPAGGCVLALCCHWRVMAEGPFKIGLNEVAVGVRVPEPIWAVARHVVGARAAERLLTGAELFEAEEARRIGLVDELVPAEEVGARARQWIESQLLLPPTTLRATRALVRRELAETFERCDARALEGFLDEWFGEEAQTALRAVVAKLATKRK
jgi:enoyl-CoA hydratase/carnithine racemase